MKVSVFGLGYVGAISCGCLARDGHEVVGVDLNADKVKMINSGRSPVVEEMIDDIIAEAVTSKRLRAIGDVSEAVATTECSLISVGTPSNPDGSLNLDAIGRVSEQIGTALREKSATHYVVVRSTVLPGTVRELVTPKLEQASGKKAGSDFFVLFNPEFLREGSSVKDYQEPPFTLLGCDAPEREGEFAAKLYEKVDAPVLFSSIETAEMTKYVCNAFHALKVTFANEVGILAQTLGVDSHRVMELVCEDTKLNISPAYMKPGFAFGGSCLPKDLKALMAVGRERSLESPLVNAIMASNQWQIKRAVDLILAQGRKPTALLGISFKEATDDLRESPLVVLAENLIGKGFPLHIYDSQVAIARLVGANRRYIENEIPHISSLMTNQLSEAVRKAEIVVVGNNSPEFRSELPWLIQEGQTVIDLVNIPELRNKTGISYHGIVW